VHVIVFLSIGGLSFWYNKSLAFLGLILVLVLLYKTYEDHVAPYFEELDPLVKDTKEIVERIEKIAVLNILPFFTMIILDRDDIQDCLVWCAIMIIGILLLIIR
jgi:hypothetical protein